MMIRELIKNAVEAAAAGASPSNIGVRAAVIAGVRKLAIQNSGPGMTSSELVAMCDIASSIRKANGLNDNFGMGAKVATLPSNAHGVRYRSNHNGRVSQVVMGKRGEAYGRLLMSGSDGERREVLDVTDQAAAEGYDLAADWTEVVLFGASADQDTVSDPYNADPKVEPGWIADALFARFFKLPAGVSLTLDEACGGHRQAHRFQPLDEITSTFTGYEAVRTEDGVVIHYYNDDAAPRVSDVGQRTGRLTAGVIHCGELYDCLPRGEWSHEAPRFGITFGARTLAVLIELPEGYPVRPDGYRQMLNYVGDLGRRVSARDFAALVSAHRPEWLLELQRKLGPDRNLAGQHRLEMEALFRSLQIPRRWKSLAPEPQSGDERVGAQAQISPSAAPDEVEYEVAPEIIPLTDPLEVQDRGLEGKAARFYPDTHQVFINELYDAFSTFGRSLEAQNARDGGQDLIRRLSFELASRHVTRAICRKVAFGIAKRDVWHPWEIEQALSMFSLSLAADAAQDQLADAADELKAALTAARSRPPIKLSASEISAEPVLEEEDLLEDFDPSLGPRIILPSYMRKVKQAVALR